MQEPRIMPREEVPHPKSTKKKVSSQSAPSLTKKGGVDKGKAGFTAVKIYWGLQQTCRGHQQEQKEPKFAKIHQEIYNAWSLQTPGIARLCCPLATVQISSNFIEYFGRYDHLKFPIQNELHRIGRSGPSDRKSDGPDQGRPHSLPLASNVGSPAVQNGHVAQSWPPISLFRVRTVGSSDPTCLSELSGIDTDQMDPKFWWNVPEHLRHIFHEESKELEEEKTEESKTESIPLKVTCVCIRIRIWVVVSGVRPLLISVNLSCNKQAFKCLNVGQCRIALHSFLGGKNSLTIILLY
ncbi:hypothetical protein IEQ34_005155 [Dendrobium chrysotoxum]|uniref:Uncharacterized protein n=1 Tax=Dendrobium chrysotoxum TaxID=161865 RepID=A0AAV7H9B7_DENCH|nr:hypothetical protein IEQ34_005155 [Dendrobium chrysotoxum]